MSEYKLVPVEPTLEMKLALGNTRGGAEAKWKAALAAAAAMTKDERTLLTGAIHVLDAILEGLADGEGIEHWQHFFSTWLQESAPLRERLKEEWSRRDE